MEYKIINNIVSFAHSGNDDVIETTDFISGVKYALQYLIEKNAIKKGVILNSIEDEVRR